MMKNLEGMPEKFRKELEDHYNCPVVADYMIKELENDKHLVGDHFSIGISSFVALEV